MLGDQQQAGKSQLVYQNAFQWWFLKPAYWSSWLAVGFLFVLHLLPIQVADKLAIVLGDLARNINAKRRRIARKNLQLCFPYYSEQQIKDSLKKHFRAQIRSVLHYGFFWWSSKKRLQKIIEIDGQQYIEQSRQAGRGIIIMTGHSVGLEAAVLAITLHYPISGPFKPMKNPLTNWLVAKGRTRFGTILYTRQAGLRPVIKDVRAGQVMFYLPDEDLGEKHCIFSDFFGVKKATIPVLGRLSKNCKADVLPCVSCYDEAKRKYIVHLLPPLENFPEGDDEADTRTMNQALEKTIMLCPEQYFWTMKFFRTRPAGEDSLY